MTPQQTAIVIERTVQGVPSRDIGQEIGTSHMAVIRNRQKPDIKARVEAGIEALINRGLIPSINTLCRFAAAGNKKSALHPDNQAIARLSLDASKTILGHVSGSGPQTVINQIIYSSGTHGELSPEATEMVQRALGIPQVDVIDV